MTHGQNPHVERALAIAATLLAGALVAAQPPANAQLSNHVGTLGAAFVSLVLSTLIVGALLVATGSYSELRGIGGFQPEHALGGIAGAAIVAVSLVTVKKLGAGGVAAATVCTQLIFSVVLDRLGAFDLEKIGLTPLRVFGIVLLIAGTVAVTSGD
ncbi:MAG TPA: DMT family transporter [Thermoleophilaceae bacterium]